jgi:hypothetical protein
MSVLCETLCVHIEHVPLHAKKSLFFIFLNIFYTYWLHMHPVLVLSFRKCFPRVFIYLFIMQDLQHVLKINDQLHTSNNVGIPFSVSSKKR